MSTTMLSQPTSNVTIVTPRHPGPFHTPWHVCMHGLGLGRTYLQPAGAAARLDPLLRMSETLLARNCTDPFQHLVHELLSLLKHHADCTVAGKHLGTARLRHAAKLIVRIVDPEARASAIALALHVGTRLDTLFAEGLILVDLQAALHELLTSTDGDARQRYHSLSTAVQLLDAAQVALSTRYSHSIEVQLTTHFYQTLTALRQLENAFDRKRLTAVLLAGYGHGQWHCTPPTQWLAEVERLLTEALDTSGPLPPADAIHTGLDFVSFPLALALTAASSRTGGAHPSLRNHAAVAALALIEQLEPASQASQFALLAPALTAQRSWLQPLRERWATIVSNYLHTSNDTDTDAYLRCTYLIVAAQSLGCTETIPVSVYRRMNAALAARERPDTGYFSWPMVISYALYLQPLRCSSMLASTTVLADLMERALPSGPVPHGEARKLSYTLLHLALCASTAAHPSHPTIH